MTTAQATTFNQGGEITLGGNTLRKGHTMRCEIAGEGQRTVVVVAARATLEMFAVMIGKRIEWVTPETLSPVT